MAGREHRTAAEMDNMEEVGQEEEWASHNQKVTSSTPPETATESP